MFLNKKIISTIHNLTIRFLLLAFFILLFINSGYSISDFKVLQTNTVIDEFGYLHLFGQIQNISNDPQDEVVVFANFFDKSGLNIGDGSGIASVRTLNAGKVSPFEVIFLDKDLARQVYNYSLDYEGNLGEEKNNDLTITSINSRPDIFGYYYVNGRILNSGNETATNVLAIASFFDTNGKIIGLSKAIAEPVNVTSYSLASFTIVMDDKLQSSKIKNYSLIGDSDQYVSK